MQKVPIFRVTNRQIQVDDVGEPFAKLGNDLAVRPISAIKDLA